MDLDTAYRIASDYTAPTVVITKHTDPVGIASAEELVEAYRRALDTDPVSSFGGIVGVNRELDDDTAPRDRRELVRGGDRARLQPGRARDPPGRSPAWSCSRSRADPTEGMRDYGIANLDFKRVGGGLLVEGLDRSTSTAASSRS